jgi:GNAT superfamily N-acetyltransferase
MTAAGIEITPLDLSNRTHLNEAATVAVRAFQYDPFFVFLTPNPLLRARGLALFWRSFIGASGLGSETYGARQSDGRLVGVAAWVKPGMFPLPLAAQARQGVGALRALYREPKAVVNGTKYLLAIEKAHLKEPHWYLELLVADPSVQRSGIGTRLQQPVLEKADAEGLPAYLETQTADNLPYYQRFGYEVAEELHPVSAGPPLWTMRREPRS